MDFVAIDFETANKFRNSACSLGLVHVLCNKVVLSRDWLIRPVPNEFDSFNTKVHGITADDVSECPTFSDVWPEICDHLSGELIVSHNTSFDISVLMRSLEANGLQCPDLRFLCTYRLSKSAYPDLCCHRLDFISKMLGIPNIHHNAASDAEACAQILCTLIRQSNSETLEELETAYGVTSGYYLSNPPYVDYGNGYIRYEDAYVPCRLVKNRSGECPKRVVDFSDVVSTYPDDDFKGKYFAFTGTLFSMARNVAMEIVSRSGGVPQNRVTSKTDFLVVGIQDVSITKGGVSLKMKRAERLNQKGRNIQIIGEDDFTEMIDDELWRQVFRTKRVEGNCK